MGYRQRLRISLQWLLLVAAVATAAGLAGRARADLPADAKLGADAPRIELRALDGEERTLRPADGKLLVVNFWATWCEPCREEARELQSFYEKHGDRVEIFAVNLTARDRLADVQAFATEHGLRFPVLLDRDSQAADAYHIAGLPTTYWIDANGIVAGRNVGPVDERWLESLLTGGDAASR